MIHFKKTVQQGSQSNNFLIREDGLYYLFGKSRSLLGEVSANININAFFKFHNFFPRDFSSHKMYQKTPGKEAVQFFVNEAFTFQLMAKSLNQVNSNTVFLCEECK